MSNLSLDFSDNTFQPLAARMRPENLAQYIGQQHLLAAGKPLPRAARIIEQMEAQGIVSEQGHNGNREVLAPPPFD